MQHSYDLVFQSMTAGQAISLEPLVQALNGRGATIAQDGRGTWKVDGGEIAIAPVMENGAVLGLDLRSPFTEKTKLIEDLVKTVCDVAEPLQLRVLDPQRGDVVSITSLGSVLDEYLKMARYAGEYGGVSEAVGLTSYAAPRPEEDSGSLRWVAVVAVFAVALYLGWRGVTLMRQKPPAPEPPPPGFVKPKTP